MDQPGPTAPAGPAIEIPTPRARPTTSATMHRNRRSRARCFTTAFLLAAFCHSDCIGRKIYRFCVFLRAVGKVGPVHDVVHLYLIHLDWRGAEEAAVVLHHLPNEEPAVSL